MNERKTLKSWREDQQIMRELQRARTSKFLHRHAGSNNSFSSWTVMDFCFLIQSYRIAKDFSRVLRKKEEDSNKDKEEMDPAGWFFAFQQTKIVGTFQTNKSLKFSGASVDGGAEVLRHSLHVLFSINMWKTRRKHRNNNITSSSKHFRAGRPVVKKLAIG